jgi:putative transposase
VERFVRSIKYECLNRMIFVGQASLCCAVAEYMGHYHGERNRQGLDNRLIRAVPSSVQGVGIVRRSRDSGGMLNFYCREAV